MSKNTLLCLSLRAQTCSCACSLYLCVRKLVLVCLYLFFSLCACGFHPTYACKILCTQDFSCTCMVLGRKLSLGILAPFSYVFHQFAILTSSFPIFAFNCMSHVISHPIVNPISLSHNSFHLIMNLIPFSFHKFQLNILVGEVPVGSWCGTTSFPRRLEATSLLQFLSLSAI